MKKGTKVIRPLGNKDISPLPTSVPVNPIEGETINKLKSFPKYPKKQK